MTEINDNGVTKNIVTNLTLRLNILNMRNTFEKCMSAANILYDLVNNYPGEITQEVQEFVLFVIKNLDEENISGLK